MDTGLPACLLAAALAAVPAAPPAAAAGADPSVGAVTRKEEFARRQEAMDARLLALAAEKDARKRQRMEESLAKESEKDVECLVRYPARVFTRDDLMNRIYDDEHIVTDRSIDAYVKRLRRKFTEIEPRLDPIETVHGLGYKLNQHMEGTPDA